MGFTLLANFNIWRNESMRKRIVALLLISTLLLAQIQFGTMTDVYATDFPANPIEKKPGWILERNDEFNGTSLDTDLWIPYYLEYRTTRDRSEARYELRDGNLVLRIDQDQLTYKEGDPMKVSSVQTGQRDYLHKDTFDHSTPTIMNYTAHEGYFEIRAKKTMNESGYHCAFWTTGKRDEAWQEAEIDILEQYGSGRQTGFNLHAWDDTTLTDAAKGFSFSFDPSEDFHIYALEWDATSIKMYVDNVLTKTINQSPSYDAVFYLSIYENSGWTGTANTTNGIPKEFIIDYFRAYRKDATVAAGPRVEAENMLLSNYSVESLGDASNAKIVKGSLNASNEASFTYNGVSGNYDISTVYYDENDGNADYKLYVNGMQIDSWLADSDTGQAGANNNSKKTNITSNIDINTGDLVKVVGNTDAWEYARIDYLELNPGVQNNSIKMEAESMTKKDYIVETMQGASNNQVTKGPWKNSASLINTFDGLPVIMILIFVTTMKVMEYHLLNCI